MPSPASVSARLLGLEQAAVRGRQARLHELAQRVEAVREAGERHGRRAALLGPRAHPHPRLRDDRERALRAEQHAVGRGPRAGGGQPPRLPQLARGGQRAHRFDEVVDVGRAGREVPARAGRDPAAERRELERLRVEPQRQPVLAELGLEPGTGRARLDARRARDGIDLEHAVERAQVDRDHARVPGARNRVDAADHARAAAERHHRHVALAAPVEHRAQLVLRGRERDAVGRVRELAA